MDRDRELCTKAAARGFEGPQRPSHNGSIHPPKARRSTCGGSLQETEELHPLSAYGGIALWVWAAGSVFLMTAAVRGHKKGLMLRFLKASAWTPAPVRGNGWKLGVSPCFGKRSGLKQRYVARHRGRKAFSRVLSS